MTQVQTQVLTYPSVAQVRRASNFEVLRWNRFLPSPKNDRELAVINAVWDRVCAMHPAEKTKVSKEVGW